MKGIVAIVGRPNVGKSTLFNRLVGERVSIEDPTSGVTRDRIYGKSFWNGKEFSIIDTGGIVIKSDDIFQQEIKKQVDLALDEADLILFMVDIQDGITPLDLDIADMLRSHNKPVFLVANKTDNNIVYNDHTEFYQLGVDTIFPISAKNGFGTGELLDAIVDKLPIYDKEDLEYPRIAIVGKPNVGKSTILNTLIGEERSIVTPIAGTTRDSIYHLFNKFNFNFYLVDTAGIRKKNRINDNIEFYSITRSIRTIENSDVCLLVIDATEGIGAQDLNILNLINSNKKSVVLVVNKWDLIEKDNKTDKMFRESLMSKLAPQDHIPIIFTSAIKKQRLIQVLEVIQKVYDDRKKRIPTSTLNKIMLSEFEKNPPPLNKGKKVKIKYCTQLPTPYPSFVFFCNLPQYVKEPYKRFTENKIREHFGFAGSPVIIYFREK
ncbi:MAG TPA: ribosome biogenesis GTPase Der [Bacteroidales bacterium]|jgi:GTP-binding protein|nr:ribosome biogenesis GTPase Der [Bacteroidales bacterium]HOJ24017.1 ribosome biogenesis GTPase Der [Bacteroidales bacterium]HON96652.1 ribosome biogenesis GTPase Der [Bacteroidales bacterium]HOS19594.1 ribosome biogenesis GTPase Der [Bacteroidales bacterium]HPL01988.1 ribosome biogenesis GTPase Der [Bacteroidales bacterium]